MWTVIGLVVVWKGRRQRLAEESEEDPDDDRQQSHARDGYRIGDPYGRKRAVDLEGDCAV
jgi:hypothetical protein